MQSRPAVAARVPTMPNTSPDDAQPLAVRKFRRIPGSCGVWKGLPLALMLPFAVGCGAGPAALPMVDAVGDGVADTAVVPDVLQDWSAQADLPEITDAPTTNDAGDIAFSDATAPDADTSATAAETASDTATDIALPCTASPDCDDGSACTIDSCLGGACAHTPVVSACCGSGKPYMLANAEAALLAPLTAFSQSGYATWSVIPGKYLGGNYEIYGSTLLLPPSVPCDPVVLTLATPILELPVTGQPSRLVFAIYAPALPLELTVQLKSKSQQAVVWDAADPGTGLQPKQLGSPWQLSVDLTPFQGQSIVLEFVLHLSPCPAGQSATVFLDDICVE